MDFKPWINIRYPRAMNAVKRQQRSYCFQESMMPLRLSVRLKFGRYNTSNSPSVCSVRQVFPRRGFVWTYRALQTQLEVTEQRRRKQTEIAWPLCEKTANKLGSSIDPKSRDRCRRDHTWPRDRCSSFKTSTVRRSVNRSNQEYDFTKDKNHVPRSFSQANVLLYKLRC